MLHTGNDFNIRIQVDQRRDENEKKEKRSITDIVVIKTSRRLCNDIFIYTTREVRGTPIDS